jgi:glyoxylase-like metal-dependent hydrolase (beta-lactamase superfamily II)
MWQYRILETGFFYADGGAMFGAIPKRAWSRKYLSDAENTCVMAMNCVLVWNDQQVILLDTGVGTKDLGRLSYYRFFNEKPIIESVRSCGFEPEQVTAVILSHLHFDHCGGCTYTDEFGNLKNTFPNAVHYVGKAQWENYLSPHALEKDSYRLKDLFPVSEQGLLTLIDTDTELFPGLNVALHDGHTVGQLVTSFRSGDRWIYFPGDVIPTRAHFSDEWISAYDPHPLASFEAKQKIKKEIENKNITLIFYHDTKAVQSIYE